MRRILCVGEALIDFISQESGKRLSEVETFKKRPGGAPFNVAIGLARLGNSVSFLAKLSTDSFGEFLVNFMKSEGVDTSLVIRDNTRHTTLAFVSIDENGKPDFEFYREEAADVALEWSELERFDLKSFDFLHVGSISLISEPVGSTIEKLFSFMKRSAMVSLDPNIRANLVTDDRIYMERLDRMIRLSDVVKLSEEDLEYLIGSKDLVEFVKTFKREDKLTFLTLGERGSMAYFNGEILKVDSWTPADVIDTTGCGDAYMAGIIHVIFRERKIDLETVEKAMEFATRVAGFVATRYGAASAMPHISELRAYPI